ncbi:hypothetical protein C4559_01765 [Candidatus Microgenomates bacterium]|nr:MAG: hypothetical protein C4559_01765 [Candidatus Microgenomates bacterium]
MYKYLKLKFIKIAIVLFVISILIVPFFSAAYAQSTNPEEDQAIPETVINLINQDRVKNGLSKLQVDSNLCKYAKLVSDEKEAQYPKVPDESKYKQYLKEYTYQVFVSSTINDVLVRSYLGNNEKVPPLSSQSVADAGLRVLNKSPYNASVTHGCGLSSSGKVGVKPFSLFIAGVKKSSGISTLIILDQIMSFFKNLLRIQ